MASRARVVLCGALCFLALVAAQHAERESVPRDTAAAEFNSKIKNIVYIMFENRCKAPCRLGGLCWANTSADCGANAARSTTCSAS
jgi:hypothetical protein